MVDEIRDHAAEAAKVDTEARALGADVVAKEAAVGDNWEAGLIDARYLGRFLEDLRERRVAWMSYGLKRNGTIDEVNADPDFVPEIP